MRRMLKDTGKRALAALLAAATIWTVCPAKAMAVTAQGAIAQGVDVSQYNGAINWGQVAASGMKFAFIKAGSTKSGVDPYFAANITGAQAAGLKTGVYLYSYATTPEAAASEANQLLQWIDGYTVNYPVVFDIEDKCHKGLSEQQLIDIINAFCTVIDGAGYYPMVYSNKNMFVGKLSICGWDKWVAQYNDTCEYNNNVCFWQYSSKAKVNGAGGNVDVNYQYKDYSSLIIPEGFLERNGTTRFYRNWRMQKGWVDYNESRYYLDGAGNLVRGWFTDPAGTYYLSPADGSITRGQAAVDGKEYYFTAEGIKTVGWVVLGEQKFYYDPAADGVMKREWLSDAAGNFYFFDRTDGHMLTGAQVIDGGRYLFSPEGVRQTGMVSGQDGTSYYDPATGQMVFGWITLGDKTYYAEQAGHIVTGAYPIEGQTYYFDATGALVRNQALTLEGVPYQTTPEGVLLPVEVPVAEPAAAAETAPAQAAPAA